MKTKTHKKFYKSIAFRIVAIYLLLFVISIGAVLSYVYWNTAGLLARQTDATIEAEIVGLSEQYRQGGISQLVRIIDQRSNRNRRNNGKSLYLVSDFTGKRLVGNLTSLPNLGTAKAGWIEFSYRVNGENEGVDHSARARIYSLVGGFKLVVGRDVQERRDFAILIEASVFWAVLLAVLLGLSGGLLISRTMIRRIHLINRTSEDIMAGDLSQRIPITGSGDEMDKLAQGLNDMLAQIQKLMFELSDVSDNIAHDLKTPLTRLRAHIETALRTNDKKTYRAALEHTLYEADGLLKTFNALLSLSRIEAGQGKAEMTRLDIGELMSDLVDLYEPLIEEEDGTLSTDLAEDISIKGDRQLISQAFSNLFDNILKYAPGTQVGLTMIKMQKEGNVRITLSDRGAGIPTGKREDVLKRFSRLDKSRSRPGSGLGLSLVKSVVDLHHGHMQLTDTAAGTEEPGLTVEIFLPLKS